MAYTKLDHTITESTIWQAPDTTRLVWITMLAMVDQNGYVGASVPGLAGRARVSLDACIAAVATLEAPDTWSRTQENEGRRIAPAEGGWVLLNHGKYRAMQNADDRRERSRIAMAALRARRKKQQLTVNTCEPRLSKLMQSEADTEEEKKKTLARQVEGRSGCLSPPGFVEFWSAYPRKVGKDAAAKAFGKRKPDAAMVEAMVAAIETQKASEQWRKDRGQFIPHPSTWLNEGRWMDEAAGANGHDFFEGNL